jgi:leader peptidase (prepilin peptidase) / N-methyltransferase
MEVILLIFLFMLGASVGSFLNVVVYRLPRDMSLVRPASRCPSCLHHIAWYDNIPIFAWFFLCGKCRYCRQPFSIKYPLVELLTALMFVGLYWVYFYIRPRPLMPAFQQGGYLIYLAHIILIAVLLASSLIDAQYWIIPLSLAYAGTISGLTLAAITPYFINIGPAKLWMLIPSVSAPAAAAAPAAAVGLFLSFLLIKLGLLKRSFAEMDLDQDPLDITGSHDSKAPGHDSQVIAGKEDREVVSIRREMLREIAFLAPAVILAFIAMSLAAGDSPLAAGWRELFSNQKWLAHLLSSLFGFMIGAAVVWATRILGSLAFGREAMGLGDVHLMAAVGAVLGWQSPVIAFFVAPFLGLGWALFRLIAHRSREIPYGPFLSMATVIVMIFHDYIVLYFAQAMTPPGVMP